MLRVSQFFGKLFPKEPKPISPEERPAEAERDLWEDYVYLCDEPTNVLGSTSLVSSAASFASEPLSASSSASLVASPSLPLSISHSTSTEGRILAQLSSQDEEQVVAWDADGCLYNTEYRRLLLNIIYENRKFFAEVGAKQTLTPDEVKQAQETLVTIKQDLWGGKYNIDEARHSEICEVLTATASIKFQYFWDNCPNSRFGLLDIAESQNYLGWLINIYIGYLENKAPDILKDILVYANKKILDLIVNQKVPTTLLAGSQRQSFWVDKRCSLFNGTPLYPFDLVRVTEYLKEQLGKDNVDLDPIFTGDVFNDLVPGTIFRRYFSRETNPENTIFDEHKIIIIALLTNYISKKYPHKKITFKFLDDRADILLTLLDFYSSYPRLIPENVWLQVTQWDGSEIKILGTIKGERVEPNEGYDYLAKLLATLCDSDSSLLKQQEININAATNANVQAALYGLSQSYYEYVKKSLFFLPAPTPHILHAEANACGFSPEIKLKP